MNEKDLLKLKERIEQTERDAARLEGQKSSLLDSLEQLGYKTVKAAEAGLHKLEDAIEEKEEALEKAIHEVEDRYNTITN